MVFSLKHLFQSPKADGPDTSLIRPSDWNAEHELLLAGKRLVGNSTDTQGDAEEIAVSGLKLEGGVLSNPAGAGSDVIVGTANPELPDARVVTDNAQIAWDKSTPNQLKANFVDGGVAPAKFQNGIQGEVYIVGVDGVSQRLAPGVAGKFLASNGADANPSWLFAGGAPHAVLQFRRGSGLEEGAFAAGAWRIRQINTELYDIYSHVTFPVVLDDAFQLEPGTYVVEWSAPAYKVNGHQSRLWNATDTAVIGIGSTAFSLLASGDMTWSTGIHRFTVAGVKSLQVQSRCETSGQFSYAAGLDGTVNEVYTTVKIWRVG